MGRLENRERKVTKFLSWMLDEKNDIKILQCYRIRCLINELRNREFNQREEWMQNVRAN